VTPAVARGAYGLRLTGLEDADDLLMPVETGWPQVAVSARVGCGALDEQWVGASGARVCLAAGGHVEIDWERGTAVFTLERPTGAAELVHPYLSTVAALSAYHDGREGFHAGALLAGGGAWAVLGDKGAGKSSLLAFLALRGLPVVADDVVILDDRGRAFAGPRLIDLRASAAGALGAGTSIGVVGTRERYRMPIAQVPVATPLRGFVVLRWADELAVESVPAARGLRELFSQRITRLEPHDPGSLLELSTLPMLELQRPHDWSAAAEAADLLLDALQAR
jgi:hypothetical protein